MLALDRTLPGILADLERVRARFPDLPLDRFEREVEAGKLQVFPLPRGVIVGQLFADGTAHVLAAAGDLAEILEFEPELRRWYRARGAERMTLRGRRGWRRVLAERGWRQTDCEDELMVRLEVS